MHIHTENFYEGIEMAENACPLSKSYMYFM